jgi:plastocyanin
VSHPFGTRARRASAAVVVAVAAALLAGCGDGDAESDSAATTTSASEASTSAGGETSGSDSSGTQTIEVSSVDFSFELPEETFAPGTYEITLTNNGNSTHDLVVERDGEDVAQSEQIGPGESSTFEVTLEAGEYVFYCSVGNHRAMGMEVPVEVTS